MNCFWVILTIDFNLMHLGLHGPHTSMRLFHTLLQVPNWVKNCLCSPFVGTQHFLRIRFSAPAYRKTNHKFFKNNAQKSKVNFYIFTWGFDVLSILIYLYKSRILGLLWSHLVLGQHRASITKREKEWYAGDCIKNTRTLDFTSCPARARCTFPKDGISLWPICCLTDIQRFELYTSF